MQRNFWKLKSVFIVHHSLWSQMIKENLTTHDMTPLILNRNVVFKSSESSFSQQMAPSLLICSVNLSFTKIVALLHTIQKLWTRIVFLWLGLACTDTSPAPGSVYRSVLISIASSSESDRGRVIIGWIYELHVVVHVIYTPGGGWPSALWKQSVCWDLINEGDIVKRWWILWMSEGCRWGS